MGWCTEFADRIEHDCDEPMLAGVSSCSCASCGVVCKGKFGACSQVWARAGERPKVRLSGPRVATTKVEGPLGPRVSRAPVAAPAAAPGATKGTSRAHHPQEPDPYGGGRAVPAVNSNGSTPSDLLSELRAMTLRIEQASSALSAREAEGETKQARLLAQLQLLPDQIARGLSAAMREQHHLILQDIRVALDHLSAELRSQEPPRRQE